MSCRDLKIGEAVWVVEREYDEAVDVTGFLLIAQTESYAVVSSYINDYDFDETIEYHIAETSDNQGTELCVYPINDCYATREEAEQKLKGGAVNG
jgi:hypothetical protein